MKGPVVPVYRYCRCHFRSYFRLKTEKSSTEEENFRPHFRFYFRLTEERSSTENAKRYYRCYFRSADFEHGDGGNARGDHAHA